MAGFLLAFAIRGVPLVRSPTWTRMFHICWWLPFYEARNPLSYDEGAHEVLVDYPGDGRDKLVDVPRREIRRVVCRVAILPSVFGGAVDDEPGWWRKSLSFLGDKLGSVVSGGEGRGGRRGYRPGLHIWSDYELFCPGCCGCPCPGVFVCFARVLCRNGPVGRGDLWRSRSLSAAGSGSGRPACLQCSGGRRA